ncbi:hypothetical protein PR048_013227 [Dryococelus australis]|uniref:Uncharacterized protein n=1 Tax=Dryococelus australis TaxID=614101 RepID=A0ABQ9HRJ7_9NEOP|nr:hypothetical protein PR048_013227 [Dryococelus australis]
MNATASDDDISGGDSDFALSDHYSESDESGSDEDTGNGHSTRKYFYGMNRSKWSTTPTTCGRTPEHSIIHPRHFPGLKGRAKQVTSESCVDF